MSSKNKEIQTLRTSLTDMVLSKEQMEQRLVQLLEVSQPDASLQEQLQVPGSRFDPPQAPGRRWPGCHTWGRPSHRNTA